MTETKLFIAALCIAFGAASALAEPQLYMAGDSIMTDYKPTEWPQYGWGQSLKSFMKEPESLHNFARSGWSARRFRESGRWENCIASNLKPGDWVIVSFGHNDKNKRRNKPPKNDYSTIDEYKAFLKGFADDAKAKGANIAFATSIAHSSGFSERDSAMTVDGGATGLGPYVNAMRELAAELNVPLLDLNRYAEENLPKLGIDGAKALYMLVRPGEYANYPDGKNDAAHIRDAGAYFYAKGAVEMARAQGLSLADLLKDPTIVPFVHVVASDPSDVGLSSSSIRVMTYNIRHSEGDRESPENNWDARKGDLADLIERESPDVVGFQEVLPEQMEFLKSRLKSYTFVGEYRNADRTSGEASPIAFRSGRFKAVKCGTFWLSETPEAAGSISWGAKYPRVCSYAVLDDSANGRRFAFANTHTDHKSEEAREKGMLLVIERMKEFSDNAPVVFVGDHNCLEYEAPSVAVSKILKDAMYLSETPSEGSWRTFNYWSYKEKELSIVEALEKPVRERSEPGDKSDQKRIDYIYVSPGTRVLGYRTIPDTRPGVKLYPSDHFPSVAEIVIGATPAEPCVVEAPGSAKLVFDTSNAPDLRAWTEEKFAPAMCEWVVRLTEIMVSDGWEPPKEILFQFVFERLQSCTNAAAWASTWKNTVNLRVDWFRKNLDGEALGATVHELTHIMQGYWSKKGITNENCPSWAREGYADYIRWILFEPESDGCGYIRKNPKKYHYNDSYRVTAHFFGFVESCYPGTMKKLNAALRDHTFDNGKFWQDATGKPVETLEADWKASIK